MTIGQAGVDGRFATPAVKPDTVVRKIDVIFAALGHDGSSRLSDLARRTGLPKTTLRRLVLELSDVGLLNQRSGRIMLGSRLAELASRLLPDARMVELIRPYAVELYHRYAIPIGVAVPEGDQVVLADSVHGPAFRAGDPPRHRELPLMATAAGWVILAFSSTARLSSVFGQAAPDIKRMTGMSAHDFSVELYAVRRTGYAVFRASTPMSSPCWAVPVFDRDDHPAAVLTVGLETPDPSPEQVQAVQTAARAIEHALARVAALNRLPLP